MLRSSRCVLIALGCGRYMVRVVKSSTKRGPRASARGFSAIRARGTDGKGMHMADEQAKEQQSLLSEKALAEATSDPAARIEALRREI